LIPHVRQPRASASGGLFSAAGVSAGGPGRCRRRQRSPPAAPTRVDPVVGLQLVLEAELLAAAVALVGLLAGVDALVALQRALVPEAAAAELALVGVVACKHTRVSEPPARPPRHNRLRSPGFAPAAAAIPGDGASPRPAPAPRAEENAGVRSRATRAEGAAALPSPSADPRAVRLARPRPRAPPVLQSGRLINELRSGTEGGTL